MARCYQWQHTQGTDRLGGVGVKRDSPSPLRYMGRLHWRAMKALVPRVPQGPSQQSPRKGLAAENAFCYHGAILRFDTWTCRGQRFPAASPEERHMDVTAGQ